jgi:hypothetical protein
MKTVCSTLGWIWLAATAHAATVNLAQNSVNDATGGSIAAVSSSQYLETGFNYTTVSAPITYSTFRFTHWTNSSAPATVYRDAWGRALNPISFVLLEATTATAHYLPTTRDTDADGIPDWYEIEYFGNLIRAASFDGDGDGIQLSAEYSGGTHPLYANAIQAGGVAYADSGMVTCNLAGYAQYTLRSVPAGTVNQATIAPPGTVVTTSDLSTNTAFGYWTLDGVRQTDAWGVALPQITFTMGTANREAVAYLFSGDTDADGVADAYEQYYYGTLANGAASDTDGDGISLLAERSGGTNPLYANSTQAGGVAWADSALVTVNLAGYSRYTLASDPAGTVNQSAIVPDGTVITTPNMTQSNFGYWTLDGVRQQDAWGVALRQVSFTVNGADRTAVAYLFAADSDGDGINDGYEQYHFGTLANGAASDTDGDGKNLLAEFTGGSNPLYANTTQAGGVAWADSSLVVVNQQIFPADNVPGGGFFSNPYTGQAGTFTMAGGSSSPALGDIDGDGDLDMIVGGLGGTVRFLRNDGSPFAQNWVETNGGLNALPHWPSGRIYPALGDWNGDGRADLAVGSTDGVVRLYQAQTGGGFAWVSNLTVSSAAVMPAFFPVSGGLDLLVLDAASGLVSRFARSSGTPPYAAEALTANLLGTPVIDGTALAVADTNNDGRMDVLASDAQGRIWRFLGQAGGSFFLESKVWGGTFNGFRNGLASTVVDIDGDGDPDIIGGGTDGALVFLRNPERHLRISPAVATVGTGESIEFTSIDNNGTLSWSMGKAQSGGIVEAATGRYTAGNTPGVDQVVTRNAAGRTGVAWVNVVNRGGSTALKWRGLLVDGRRGPNDPVWPAAHALNTRAREVLIYRGLSDSEILWLGHGTGPDSLPTRAGLASALSDGSAVAEDTEVLMVYLVDHGRVASNGDGLFLLSENESVSGTELDAWLDRLQSTRPGLSVVVMVESCFGGRVAGPMMAVDAYSSRRLVLSSSGANELAHLAANGLVSYSSMWWSGAAAGKSLGQAHVDAVSAMTGLQSPKAGTGGATLAAGKLGLEQIAASGRPVVSVAGGDISLQGTQEARLTAAVESAFALDKVWGVIVPPGYQPSGDDPVVDLPEVQLARDAATGEWVANVGGFSEGGAPYTVLLQARDVWGQVSPPAILHVSQATVRNRVIIFAPGEDDWAGARVAGSLAEYARESSLLRRVRAADVKMLADASLGVETSTETTASALQDAIENWANADGQLGALTLYLVGQGSQEGLVCANGDTVTPADLQAWLDTLQDASGAVVQVIVDADYSGRFVQGSGNSSHRRILLSSTGSSQRNTFANGRWSNVTRWIWNSIARGRDLRESYGEAIDLARMIGGEVPALFDDNGDGTFTKLRDGLKAINSFVGSAYVTADDPPFIGKASAAMHVAAGQSARFWVSNIVMPDGDSPAEVWGEVIGPDGTTRGSVALWRNLAKNRHEGSFGGFSEAGRYLVFVQAGTPGDPANTTPPAIIQIHYISAPNTGAPATSALPVLTLPTDGQAMDVETDAGSEWRINLIRGQRVVIDASEVSARRDVALQLTGSGGQILATVDQWGDGFGESINGWEAPADGSYLLRASFSAGNGAATCRVRAYIAYEAGASEQGILTLQTINFPQPASRNLSEGSFAPLATATSGLPVRFEVVSGPASLSGHTITPTAVGDVIIRALQDGDATWESAEPIKRTMTITATAVQTYEAWAQEIFGADYAAKGGPGHDPDGDGQTNQVEWQAKTHPLNAADKFKVATTTSDATGFKLRWQARAGVNYRVMATTNLTTWTELPNSRVTGSGGEAEVTDLSPPAGGRFYRVEIVQP